MKADSKRRCRDWRSPSVTRCAGKTWLWLPTSRRAILISTDRRNFGCFCQTEFEKPRDALTPSESARPSAHTN
jgi:hypothetical protein